MYTFASFVQMQNLFEENNQVNVYSKTFQLHLSIIDSLRCWLFLNSHGNIFVNLLVCFYVVVLDDVIAFVDDFFFWFSGYSRLRRFFRSRFRFFVSSYTPAKKKKNILKIRKPNKDARLQVCESKLKCTEKDGQ